MQGVEQEVRLELHLQPGEPGLGELRFELRRPQLALTRRGVLTDAVIDKDHRPVQGRVRDEPEGKRPHGAGEQRCRLRRGTAGPARDRVIQRGESEHDDARDSNVQSEPEQPGAALQRPATPEPQDPRREKHPPQRRRHLRQQRRADGPRPIAHELVDAPQQSPRHPGAEDKGPAPRGENRSPCAHEAIIPWAPWSRLGRRSLRPLVACRPRFVASRSKSSPDC